MLVLVVPIQSHPIFFKSFDSHWFRIVAGIFFPMLRSSCLILISIAFVESSGFNFRKVFWAEVTCLKMWSLTSWEINVIVFVQMSLSCFLRPGSGFGLVMLTNVFSRWRRIACGKFFHVVLLWLGWHFLYIVWINSSKSLLVVLIRVGSFFCCYPCQYHWVLSLLVMLSPADTVEVRSYSAFLGGCCWLIPL